MSSAAMALNGIGNTQMNPSVLNKWLTSNSGYVKDDLFVWASINPWGVSFKGFITNDKIGQYISNGYIVIVNVHNGGHWVLATSYQGDTIYVNDPGYSTTYYTLAQIVNGNTGVYTLNRLPNFLSSWLLSI
jgi:ABC-type bacteriocin/lantibiotic exporter with double-glycine peptidase domain